MNHLETYGSITQLSQQLRRLLQQSFSVHPMVRLIDRTADFSAAVIQDISKTCPLTYQFFTHSKRGFVMVSPCLVHWLVEELLGINLESHQSTLHGFLTQVLIEDVFFASFLEHIFNCLHLLHEVKLIPLYEFILVGLLIIFFLNHC